MVIRKLTGYKSTTDSLKNVAMQTNLIANAVWNLCHVLRDDGIVYHKYLSELTYLIFLKTASETGFETALPEHCRWRDLSEHPTVGILGFYRKMLTALGEDSKDVNVREIFSFPTTVFSHDENLAKVVAGIDAIDWHSGSEDGLGNIYEALLERNATEARSGSGQYFTPRALVDSIIRLVKPSNGDIILDPSAGTGGFLISANDYINRSQNKNSINTVLFNGIEIEHDTYRLCLMNLFLHGMAGEIVHGDALTDDARHLMPADIIIANPPFGASAGGARQRRADLPVQTTNKQLMFLQAIYLSLKESGRAAVVVPDNVISDGGAAEKVRLDLIEKCHLHTVLRLPDGIFYAPGVKTNVLFFCRNHHGTQDHETWIYDMRSDSPRFGRSRPLSEKDFAPFEEAFGEDPLGRSRRQEGVKWKKFTRREIAGPDGGTKLSWLAQTDHAEPRHEQIPSEIIAEMAGHLREALAAIEQMSDNLIAELEHSNAS